MAILALSNITDISIDLSGIKYTPICMSTLWLICPLPTVKCPKDSSKAASSNSSTGMHIPNISPAILPYMHPSDIVALILWAISFNTWSPKSFPKISFIILKLLTLV